MRRLDAVLGALGRFLFRHEWVVLVALVVAAVLLSMPGAHAATQGSFTGWRDGGAMYCYTATTTQVPYSTSAAAAGAACANYLNTLHLAGSCGGTLTAAYAGGTSPSQYTMTNSAGGGSCAAGNLSGSITSTPNMCPAGFVYRTDIAMCTDVNDTAGSGGGCKAGQSQTMEVAPGTIAGGPGVPYNVSYGGCNFVLAQGRLIKDNGTVMALGVFYSDGTVLTGSTGAASSPIAPAVEAAACPNSQITNITTGVVTCVESSDASPSISTIGGADAAGNPTVTQLRCVGSACVQTTQTTISGTTTTGKTTTAAGQNNCGSPGEPACKMDETGTSDSAGAAGEAASVVSSYATRSAAATAAGSSGDASAFGLPKYVAPIDDASKIVNPFAGSDDCVNPSATYRGVTFDLPVCTVLAPVKPILAWFLSVMTGFYAWARFTGRIGKATA